MTNKDFTAFPVTSTIDVDDPIDVMALQRVFAVLAVAGVEMHFEDGMLYASVQQMEIVSVVMMALNAEVKERLAATNG